MGAALEGKIALITGSSKGIGRAIALKLSENGADVIINGRSSEDGIELVKKIEDMGKKAIFEKGDITIYDEMKEMVDRVLQRMPGIDILVASGGVISGGKNVMTAPNFFRDIDPENYIDFFNSQYFSRLFCVKAVLITWLKEKVEKLFL